MKQTCTKILFLEDNPNYVKLIEKELHKSNLQFQNKVVSNKVEFVKAIDTFNPDIIISEYCLPSFGSKEALAIVRASSKKAPFILFTSNPENHSDEMMNEGAYDYLLKDDLHNLPVAIRNALTKYSNETKFSATDENQVNNENLLKETESLAHIGSWQFNFISGKGTWSEESFRILGYEPGEVVPTLESFLDRVHPYDLEFVQKEIYKVESGKLPSNKFELRVVQYTTKEIKYLQTKINAEYKTGKLFRVSGFIRDITTEKIAQQNLIKSQTQLVTSQRMAHIGNVEVLFQENEAGMGFPIRYSEEVIRIFGLTAQEKAPSLEEIYTLIHPADLDFVKKTLSDARQTGKSYNIEYRIIRPDKSVRFLRSKGEVVKNEVSGKSLKLIATVQDITEYKEEEHALNRSNAKLKTIFDNTETSFILVNRDLQIVSFNKAAHAGFIKDTGKTLCVGLPIIDFVLAEKKQRALDMYKRVFEGEQFKLEDSFTRPDGSILWYYMQLLPIYGDDNKIFKMMLSIRDITAKKIAEIEREKITSDLIQRNIDLEQFSYIISHNLRLPVANIMGLIDNFDTNKLPTEEQRETISAIYISVRALDDVVLDLNRILRVRNNAIERKQIVKLSDIGNETKVALGFAIKKDNAIIDTDFSEIDELLTVKSYLSSIFYNLVLNSIKFRKPALSPHIKISSKKKDNKTILTFSDNGLGIDLCKNGKDIFGLYKRFHPHITGKGMGLYMVKCQVEAMGGKITASSEPGKGTIFTIEFDHQV